MCRDLVFLIHTFPLAITSKKNFLEWHMFKNFSEQGQSIVMAPSWSLFNSNVLQNKKKKRVGWGGNKAKGKETNKTMPPKPQTPFLTMQSWTTSWYKEQIPYSKAFLVN